MCQLDSCSQSVTESHQHKHTWRTFWANTIQQTFTLHWPWCCRFCTVWGLHHMVHPLGSCNSEIKSCETFFIFKWKEMSPKCDIWAKKLKKTPINRSLCLNAYTCYKLHQWDHQHPQTFTEKDTQLYKVNYVCFRQKHHVVPTGATCGFEMKHLGIFSCKSKL